MNQKYKYAVGITLYNPTAEQFELISRLRKSFDLIFVFDNSDKTDLFRNIDWPKEIVYITGGGNLGLPYAFNCIIQKCSGVDFLCTLDQDSTYTYDAIGKMKDYINNCETIDTIGIIAPYINYGYNNCSTKKIVSEEKWVIASGSFLNLKQIIKLKIKYDENYFIDRFEIDFCKSLLENGLKVLVYHKSVLNQQLGENSGHNHPNHSKLRHYYIFRNRFYFNKKWYSNPLSIFLSVIQTTKHICLIILYEDNKLGKIYTIKQAVEDYNNKKMGKIEDKQ